MSTPLVCVPVAGGRQAGSGCVTASHGTCMLAGELTLTY